MSKVLYHNPRCSKSREALKILTSNNIQIEIKEYLKEGLTEKEILSLKKKLNLPTIDFVRKKESIFQDLALSTKSEKELCKAIVEHPILLERPIFVNGDKAVVGRPPEDILKIL